MNFDDGIGRECAAEGRRNHRSPDFRRPVRGGILC